MYTCIYIYISIHELYANTDSIYLYTQTPARTSTPAPAYIHIYIYVYIYIYIYTHVHIYTHIIYTHIETAYIHTYTYRHRHLHIFMCIHTDGPHASYVVGVYKYGVTTCSRLLKIIRLFCKRALWKRRYPAEKTYNLK